MTWNTAAAGSNILGESSTTEEIGKEVERIGTTLTATHLTIMSLP